MLFKIIVILLLLVILISLFSGLFSMSRSSEEKRGRDLRTVRALTVRIAVSLLLFGMLITGYHLGWFGK